MLLRHLDKPRTIAELRALTGESDPDIRDHLRRLGPRVRVIPPADPVNSRAIRYQRVGGSPEPQRCTAPDPQPAEPRRVPIRPPERRHVEAVTAALQRLELATREEITAETGIPDGAIRHTLDQMEADGLAVRHGTRAGSDRGGRKAVVWALVAT